MHRCHQLHLRCRLKKEDVSSYIVYNRHENIHFLRYWIAVTVVCAETLPILKQHHPEDIDNAAYEEKINSIICDVVPGYSKTVLFY